MVVGSVVLRTSQEYWHHIVEQKSRVHFLVVIKLTIRSLFILPAEGGHLTKS